MPFLDQFRRRAPVAPAAGDDAHAASRHVARRMPEYGVQYLESLVTEFLTLKLECNPPDPKTQGAILLIEETLKKERLSWADIFVIERAILRLQSPERVRSRTWSMRDKYRLVIGEQAYASYENSSPPDPANSKTTPEQLRADLDQLLGEFHWIYLTTPLRERARNHLSKQIALSMFFAMLVIILAMLYDFKFDTKSNVSSVLMVLFMGAIGAFLSLQHRIQSLPSSGDAIFNILTLKYGWVSIILAPISGAIFAFVVYLAFAAGLLQGSIFPEMGASNAPAIQRRQPSRQQDDPPRRAVRANRSIIFSQFLWDSIPRDYPNFAVLLLWCFIAGFAERLIPDTLDRMIIRRIAVLTTETPKTFAPVGSQAGDRAHEPRGAPAGNGGGPTNGGQAVSPTPAPTT